MSESEEQNPEQPIENAQSVEFEALDHNQPTSGGPGMGMDTILNIPVKFSVELGRTKIQIQKLLELTQGSIVELDKQAGDHFDVFANGTLIAHGEIVVVNNDKFGIRLSDVLTPIERYEKIK